jgi:hypothetical protein
MYFLPRMADTMPFRILTPLATLCIFISEVYKLKITEHRGFRYPGGGGFKSLHGDRVFRLIYFAVFLSPSRQTSEIYIKLGHDRILTYPFQLTGHYSSYHSTLYSSE